MNRNPGHANAALAHLPAPTHAWLREHRRVFREVLAIELARPRARHNNQHTPVLTPAEACRRADSLRRRRQKATVAIFSLYDWSKSV